MKAILQNKFGFFQMRPQNFWGNLMGCKKALINLKKMWNQFKRKYVSLI